LAPDRLAIAADTAACAVGAEARLTGFLPPPLDSGSASNRSRAMYSAGLPKHVQEI